MSSDNWFDWDTGEEPKAEKPEKTRATEPAPIESATPAYSEITNTPSESSPSEPVESLEPLVPTEPLVAQAPLAPPLRVHREAPRPYHLWIEGRWTTLDQERLSEILSREEFGIREVDLQLQFESGRVLLPRISEYAAVLVAQALRESSLALRMLPSELATGEASLSAPPVGSVTERGPDSAKPGGWDPLLGGHPADAIPVTSENAVQGHDDAETLDVLIATGLIAEPEWKAEHSDGYSALVERLKRELRFKAHLRGAQALVRFEAKILKSPFISERECRVQVSAAAVRFR